jgi:hypothetical protein
MKKLLLILLCLPMIGFGQTTYVPDDNFEAYLEANGMGNSIPNDDYVTTANINTVTFLNVNSQNIADLTGIEDFTLLNELWCDNNHINNLNISNNLNLKILSCADNLISNINLSNNSDLVELWCSFNPLISLDVSNNILLEYLDCDDNQLTSLDVSNNTVLEELDCEFSQLSTLNIKNGNNINMIIWVTNNPNLYCITVDDSVWSTNNWVVGPGQNFYYEFDPQHYFSNNCSGTSIQEHSTNKKLLKTIDLLGRETKNAPLFYIYDDGTVEKRIVIE